MQLNNFGSILSFAAELESKDEAFYQSALQNAECVPYKPVFEQLLADSQKNQKMLQRVRRENVTEMILEPIKDFTRAPFCEECAAADSMGIKAALATAARLVDRAERYYTEAAEKIKAQPEVSRALKTICKKHKAHREQLAAL
jgi:rubrerythrin